MVLITAGIAEIHACELEAFGLYSDSIDPLLTRAFLVNV